MPRAARVVIPGAIHHVTQRGGRKQRTFFGPEDYVLYRDLLATKCEERNVELLQYCLMPNHVHLLVRPADARGMSSALKAAHSMYARRINARNEWTGHLWQSRYWSHAVTGSRVLAAVRYIARNPIRAGLVDELGQWRPASTRDLLGSELDPWLGSRELRGYLDNWSDFLMVPAPDAELGLIRSHTRTGAPLLPHIDVRQVA